ncbi:hypothetical protein EON65_54710 [archaeon]|nr:MAG: hypothetical protein EON65_54710 [archaeon]
MSLQSCKQAGSLVLEYSPTAVHENGFFLKEHLRRMPSALIKLFPKPISTHFTLNSSDIEISISRIILRYGKTGTLIVI